MKSDRMDHRAGISEVLKASRAPLLLTTAALLLGVPSYFFFSRWARASPALPAASPEVAVGRLVPDLSLPDELGRPVSLAALRGHPTVLVFYRGAMCVACRAQLSSLAAQAAPFIAGGVRVFGVSADPPPVSAEWKDTLRLPFSLLSDPQQSLAQSLCSARAHCLVLVDPDGRIRWGALNDYWRGAERADTVLLAADRMSRH
jgi:peroxiredoxin